MDSVFLQDGYNLYIHSVIVAKNSPKLLVVQQGMNTEKRMARRYHLTSASFTNPHSGIAGVYTRITLDAASEKSREARRTYVEILSEGVRRFEKHLREANKIISKVDKKTGLELYFSDITQTPIAQQYASKIPWKPYYKPVRPSPNLLRAISDLSKQSLADERDLL
jgi:hypothetical protein